MSVREIQIPQKFIDKYGSNFPIYSYSKCSSLDNCIYEYYLSRIKKVDIEENIYGVVGGIVHDILEKFYNKEIKFDDMPTLFEDKFFEIEMLGYCFNKTDKVKNETITKSYVDNIKHFFENHNIINSKIFTEKEVWIDIKGNVFVGYIDAIYRENKAKYVVLDYKTSSMSGYTGKKKDEKAMQLLLYALALKQANIPLENIKCGWNFLKYVNVTTYQVLKSGKVKEKVKIAERYKWVKELENQIKKELVEYYPDMLEWEIDILFQECVDKNNLDKLPQEIKDKFDLSDCIVYIDVNEQTIKNLENYLLDKIKEIKDRTEKKDWDRKNIDKNDLFYCTMLCGCKNHCKYYKDYVGGYRGSI
ncbi:MAG: PD-(D/E)XK nuclease family protein [Lachnospirales bacterium]